MNTKVNFIRGLTGMGVVIEIRYNTSQVIFDFGAPFEPLTQIYDGTVLYRNKNRLKDSILLNKAPLVDYVYTAKDLQDIQLQPSDDSPYTTAVFISHCHLDHMCEIDKIDKKIPVYLHEDGLKLKQALEDIGEEEYIREYSSFNYHETINVGEIKVTPYFSDHCCIGAAGFLIETKDARIYYSGDIRFHGMQAEDAYKEIELFNKDIDLLIVDSTTSSAESLFTDQSLLGKVQNPSKEILPGETTEADIYNDITTKLTGYNGLGIFNLYHRDVKMISRIIAYSIMVNRTAVFEPATAYIINKLLGFKVSVLIDDSIKKPDYYQQVINNNIVVSKQQVINNPEKYFVQNSYRHILELTDYTGIEGCYFHLFGEPLTNKEKHYFILQNILNKLNWKYNSYINLYSFSHAYPNHLAYFIKEVNPKAVVGVHSKHPENMNTAGIRQLFPEENHQYDLAELIK